MTAALPPARSPGISTAAAAALGVGGMMGAGLYTLVGLAATSAGAWLPIAFLLAGIAALFSVYSYSKLGSTYPSTGGAAQFIVVGLGRGLLSGGLNTFQYAAYLIATALYAAGFAEYATALAGDTMPSWAAKVIGVAVVVGFAAVNLLGSALVGRAESVIVAIQVSILLGFVVLGAFKADPSKLTMSGSTVGVIGVLTAAALLYNTYQGFGVVTNAAGEMRRPRLELPRSLYLALGIVTALYLAVSTLIVLLVPESQILADSGHVLADAGEMIAGRAGFVVIAAAALLSTASATNATIFAAANVGSDVAANRQLPHGLTRTLGSRLPLALAVSTGAVIVIVLFFPLAAVGQMASLAFLVVYGAVSAGHLRLRAQTGARAWPLVAAVGINAVLFATLLANTIRTGPAATWVALLAALIGSFVFEAVYRRRRRPASPGSTP
jgi:amino acid transporter